MAYRSKDKFCENCGQGRVHPDSGSGLLPCICNWKPQVIVGNIVCTKCTEKDERIKELEAQIAQ